MTHPLQGEGESVPPSKQPASPTPAWPTRDGGIDSQATTSPLVKTPVHFAPATGDPETLPPALPLDSFATLPPVSAKAKCSTAVLAASEAIHCNGCDEGKRRLAEGMLRLAPGVRLVRNELAVMGPVVPPPLPAP